MRTDDARSAHREPGGPTRDGASDVRRAWWSLPFLVLSFLVAYAAAEGVAALLGYADGSDQVPPWPVMLVVLLVFVGVLAVPVCVAGWYARRARRAGARNTSVPVVVGTLLVTMFIVLNVVSAVVTSIR